MKLKCLLSLLLIASTSQGALLVFTDRATWAASVGGSILTEDFESAAPGFLAAGTTDLGLVSVTIDNNDEPDIEILETGFINGSREYSGDIDVNNASFNTFTFPLSVIGFGADFRSTLTGDLLTVEVDGTFLRFGAHMLSPGDGFLGVISSNPFSNITFRSEALSDFGEAYQIDNLSFSGVVTLVPEPHAAVLLAAGLAAVALRRKFAR